MIAGGVIDRRLTVRRYIGLCICFAAFLLYLVIFTSVHYELVLLLPFVMSCAVLALRMLFEGSQESSGNPIADIENNLASGLVALTARVNNFGTLPVDDALSG